MNTTGQPREKEPGKPPGEAAGARADTLNVVLLILTILVLTGAAAGIVIGFPQALEVIAVQAHAAVAAPDDVPAPQPEEQSADESQEESEPYFADDIRSIAAVYATADAGAAALSALQSLAVG